MEGLSSKNEKRSKNGFPNVALEGVDKRRPNLVSKRERTVERRGKERRRGRGREEEEEKKREKPRSKVWNYDP